MPFQRSTNPTPAALAKRIRRLAAGQALAAHRGESGWMILDPNTGYVSGYRLTHEAALELLERLRKRRAS